MRTLGFLGGNPMWEKTTAAIVSVLFLIIIKKIFLQYCTGEDSYQHAGIRLPEATTSTRSLAPTRRELLPTNHLHRLLPKRSSDYLSEGYEPQHLYGPHFKIFIQDPPVNQPSKHVGHHPH